MKYLVTLPDGTTKTRISHRKYTHAIAVRRGERWSVTSFCGSLLLAEKELATQQRLEVRRKDYQGADYVEPVKWLVLPAVVEP